MEHEPHVGAVDAHPEGDRGYDHVDRLLGEGVLGAVPLLGVEAGMVGPGQKPLGGEPGRQPFGLAPRDAIHDRGLAAVAAEDRERLRDAVGAGHDPVDEIGAVEGADEHRRVTEVELLRDVVPHPGCGGGREGMQARPWEPLPEQGQLAVFRPEVVAPLADAVRFVDREPLHAHAGERVEQARIHKPLGGGEQQPQFSRHEPVADRPPLLLREAGMERRRRVADRLEGIDLILHQGHQRRDHDVGGVAHEGWQLVAEALAASGRHYHERIPPGERRVDRLGLERPQCLEAPPPPEHVGHRPVRNRSVLLRGIAFGRP